ncbi:helix-turn-helix domain-containing protein [Kutzneria sp. 744]|uniref:winged helix-turn-helix transcriptional regulator n=1 Tax=Kutzneria sp. (strain 744) TaxID=345341 RepID=UPI0005C17E75|nr:helix-turn-helix domain-containing protein [Kutzneria sp. 744]
MTGKPKWLTSTAIWSTRVSLARIDNKWTAMVVLALGKGGLRFGDLRVRIGGISAKMLTETLRDLERDGLVARHIHAEMPPRVQYELTDLGRSLYKPLQAIGRWAEEHTAEVLAARDAYDARQ